LQRNIPAQDTQLLTTTATLVKRFGELLRFAPYRLVVVDDVDSVIRATSRNIDRILRLAGVDEEALSAGLEYVRAVREAARSGSEEARRRLEEVRRVVEGHVARLRGSLGQLLVSGAVVKSVASARLALFRLFFGFAVGGRAEGLRRVYDLYVDEGGDAVGRVVELVKLLGPGGIIYVPPPRRELVDHVVEALRAAGVSVGDFTRPRRELLEAFERGEVSVLVGVATARSPLVRGIDLPHVIRYVVFLGVPRIRFRLRLDEFRPLAYAALLRALRRVVPREERIEIDRALARLRTLAAYSARVERAVSEGAGTDFEKRLVDSANRVVELAKRLLSRPEVLEAIRSSPEVSLEFEGGELVVVVPDVTTYVQGSGRTSRLYAGGVTRGVSVVVVDDWKAFEALRREVRLRFQESEFRRVEEADLGAIMREVDEDREAVRRVLAGELPRAASMDVRTTLLIVESPTKARTIASFFGRPGATTVGWVPAYEVATGGRVLIVVPSLGHVYDLPTNLKWHLGRYPSLSSYLSNLRDVFAVGVHPEGVEYAVFYNTIKRCQTPEGLESFTDDIQYVKSSFERFKQLDESACRDSLDVINALRDLAMEVDEVLIGTDPDAEGEKIGADIALSIYPVNRNVRRVEFHEVTRPAIARALSEAKQINAARVLAQVVRRVEDRWLGFALSRFVQRSPEVARAVEEYLAAGLARSRPQEGSPAWRIQRYVLLKAVEYLAKKGGYAPAAELNAYLAKLIGFNKLAGVWRRYREFIAASRRGRATVAVLTSRGWELAGRLEEELGRVGDAVSLLRDMVEAKRRALSAGRVQTPVLGMVVVRTREARRSPRCVYELELGGVRARVEGSCEELGRLPRSGEVVLEVEDLGREVVRPPPPYTTDALLSDGVAVLGASTQRVMALAQDLFESGLITYHRTDSVRVSPTGMQVAREWLESRGLHSLYRPRAWAPEEAGAHEAIRPTRPMDSEELRALASSGVLQLQIRLTEQHIKLYDLVFRRFMASQMVEAELRRVRYVARVGDSSVVLAEGYVYEPVGWLKIYEGVEQAAPIRLVPRLPTGRVSISVVSARRYLPLMSEAQVIAEMKRRGIGRPSTYARIVATILERGYVKPIGRARLLRATSLGEATYDLLSREFGAMVSEERTRVVERMMDEVEASQDPDAEAVKALSEFYREVAGDPRLSGLIE